MDDLDKYRAVFADRTAPARYWHRTLAKAMLLVGVVTLLLLAGVAVHARMPALVN
jgi:hypothetical protein